MSDPTEYVPGYSFTSFQANSPTGPLPATKLDNELADISASVKTLVAAIKRMQRSDGALKNNVVTFDSLALSLQLTFDPTNGELVAAAVLGAQANAASAASSQAAAAGSALAASNSAIAAAASAASVDLNNYLAKANNLSGLANRAIARSNLDLGNGVTWNLADPGTPQGLARTNINGKLVAYDGSLLTGIDTLPIGTTIYINDDKPPVGFLRENGALYSRVTYPRLWAFALQSGNLIDDTGWLAGYWGRFSTGDTVNTFRVPDGRGEFIRGFDDSRGVDSGRVTGTSQGDLLKDHTHNTNQPGSYITPATVTGGASSFFWTGGPNATASGAVNGGLGGSETRPRNIAKLACIKAY